ncbi:MAG: hypothetical protein K0R57_5547 [Paenibacillaceae bacterium]|nr:hypothetical protein [Paenibacillaceae bacterium]
MHRRVREKEKALHTKYSRSIYFARMSVPLNAVMAVGKIVLGIFSFSVFLCVNAFYNIGIACAKYSAVKAHEDAKAHLAAADPAEIRRMQHNAYRLIGVIVLASSIVYLVYCLKILFFGDDVTRYHEYIAIAIAAVTFTEIAVSLHGAVSARRNEEPVIEAIKLTNLASSLISLVLTQTAIMSFTHEGDTSFYNGMSGIIFGTLAALIGLYMILRNPERESARRIIPLLRSLPAEWQYYRKYFAPDLRRRRNKEQRGGSAGQKAAEDAPEHPPG